MNTLQLQGKGFKTILESCDKIIAEARGKKKFAREVKYWEGRQKAAEELRDKIAEIGEDLTNEYYHGPDEAENHALFHAIPETDLYPEHQMD